MLAPTFQTELQVAHCVVDMVTRATLPGTAAQSGTPLGVVVAWLGPARTRSLVPGR